MAGLAIMTVAAANDGPPSGDKKPQWQRMLAPSDAKRAEELEQRYEQLARTGKFAESEAAITEVIALRTRLQGADHWQTVSERWVLAAVKAVNALPAARRLEWYASDGLDDMADDLEKKGEYAKALALREKRVRVCQASLGDTHPQTATALSNLAYVLGEMGRRAEAEPHLRAALDRFRQAYGETHPETVTGYNNLALHLYAIGQPAEAEPLLRRALAARRDIYGDADPGTAQGYVSLAAILADLGRAGEAEPMARTALTIRTVALGRDHPLTASAAEKLAVVLAEQGRHAEAETLFRVACDTLRAARGSGHPDTLLALNNLAACLIRLNRPADAETLAREVVAGWRKANREDGPEAAAARDNLAGAVEKLGRPDEALAIARAALEARSKALGAGHPGTLKSVASVAGILAEAGRVADAVPLYKRAADGMRTAVGRASPATVTLNHNLGVCYLLLGNLPEAVAAQTEATAGYEKARLAVAGRGLARAAFTGRVAAYPVLAVALARSGRAADAWAAVETGLARGLLEQAGPQGDLAPAERTRRDALAARLAAAHDRVTALVTRRDLSPDQQRSLDAARADRDRLEAELGDLAAAASRREVADLATVQAALPADSALLVWVDFRGPDKKILEHWACVVRPTGPPVWERLSASGKSDTREPATGLSNRFRSAVGVAAASDVDRLAQEWRDQWLAPVEKHLTGVRRLLVVPVGEPGRVPLELAAGRFTVAYVPSGTFLARLRGRPRPTGTDALAVGDPAFDRPSVGSPIPPKPLPSGGLLITQVDPQGNAAAAGVRPGDVLLKYAGADLPDQPTLRKLITAAVDGPNVPAVLWREGEAEPVVRELKPGRLGVGFHPDPAPAAVAARRAADATVAALAKGGTWDPLPGSRAELDGLAGLFGDRLTALSGSAASEQRLDELRASGGLGRYRYVHFATHGVADDTRAFESALILAQDRLPAGPPTDGQRWADGKLTAAEVLSTWQLDADLVALSACETALGRAAGGDGLLGFSQAFLGAGARTVCLSLWKVDDAATALLMRRFYQNLLGKRPGLDKPLGKAAALAEAKAWLRDLPAAEAAALAKGLPRGAGVKLIELVTPAVPGTARPADDRPFAHPRYWAAFVLIGDPD